MIILNGLAEAEEIVKEFLASPDLAEDENSQESYKK